jgi:hypothetical protein
MARLSFKQILFAIAVGAVFAALQSARPVPALKKVAAVTCSFQPARC